jgi:hypothetical protein
LKTNGKTLKWFLCRKGTRIKGFMILERKKEKKIVIEMNELGLMKRQR